MVYQKEKERGPMMFYRKKRQKELAWKKNITYDQQCVHHAWKKCLARLKLKFSDNAYQEPRGLA